MTGSARRSLALASLVALVLVASGLEVRCDGAGAQSRTTIASLQAEIDLLGLRVAMLEASASGYQFKGFSGGNVRGDGGVLAMTSACAATFAGSRMCTSREILETTVVPNIAVNTEAWVRPNFTPVATGTATSVALDESGVPTLSSATANGTAEDMSCRGWTATSNQGLVVNRNGSFRLQGCNNNRPVACCGP
jgi:hypothetical protein